MDHELVVLGSRILEGVEQVVLLSSLSGPQPVCFFGRLDVAKRSRGKLQHFCLKLSGFGAEDELAGNAGGFLSDCPGQVELWLGMVWRVHRLCSDTDDSRMETDL